MKFNDLFSSVCDGLKENLRIHEYKTEHFKKCKVTSHFTYLDIRNQKVCEDELIEILYKNIVPYCIPTKRINTKRAEGKNEDLEKQAKSLFIKSSKQRVKAGEIGELALFLFQEHFLKAPQIAAKMFLKTSSEMPIHGSDGIHLLKLSGNDYAVLWGESKLYQNPVSAAKDIISSICSFSQPNPDTGYIPRERDLQILNDHNDITDETLLSFFQEYFNPYSESNNSKQAYACLIGFNFKSYKRVLTKDKKEIEDFFKDEYSKKIEDICRAFSNQIRQDKLDQIEFHFFILPLQSVKDFRTSFYKKMDYTSNEEPEVEPGNEHDAD